MSRNDSTHSEKLRNILREERIRRRISQSVLALRIGKSRKWLSDFERGLIEPSYVTVFALALELDITITLSPAADIEVASRQCDL